LHTADEASFPLDVVSASAPEPVYGARVIGTHE